MKEIEGAPFPAPSELSASELESLCARVLRANRRDEATYNQVARALGYPIEDNRACYKTYVEPVRNALNRLVVSDSGTVRYSGNKHAITLSGRETLHIPPDATGERPIRRDAREVFYKWSPARKRMDREPPKSNSVIEAEIGRFLARQPYSSAYAVRQELAVVLGHVDVTRVTETLRRMSAERRLVATAGRQKNSFRYRLPDPYDAQAEQVLCQQPEPWDRTDMA